ncbi:MAG: hypothetical protein QM564_05105 [Bergeyella sp.]
MMNPRILEIIQSPELTAQEDLPLLQEEIRKYPYVQSIRALHLYATHLMNPEDYKKELSKTAAYTTDKKILYQFINRKNFIQKTVDSKPEIIENKFVTEDLQTVIPQPAEEIISENSEKKITGVSEEIKPEVAENESIAEVSQEVNSQPEESYDAESFSKEEIVEENIIEEEKPEIADVSILSFHGTEQFLPDIKMEPKTREAVPYEVPKPKLSRHEEEMQRLIAEVEAKMKANKKPKTEQETEEPQTNFDINFVETHEAQHIVKQEKTVAEAKPEIPEETLQSEPSDWKPMYFQTSQPDASIALKKEEPKENPAPVFNHVPKEMKEERPVMNVSFLSDTLSVIPEEKTVREEESAEEKPLENNAEQKPERSNIPHFINTWQNWLKLNPSSEEADKKPEEIQIKQETSTEEIKQQAIEKFIETEPKISKLKEETDFVIKEKPGDISHLMTETLAKLYTQQRLYSKAIKAYEILKTKHPENAEHFEKKIEEIKTLKSNGNK